MVELFPLGQHRHSRHGALPHKHGIQLATEQSPSTLPMVRAGRGCTRWTRRGRGLRRGLFTARAALPAPARCRCRRVMAAATGSRCLGTQAGSLTLRLTHAQGLGFCTVSDLCAGLLSLCVCDWPKPLVTAARVPTGHTKSYQSSLVTVFLDFISTSKNFTVPNQKRFIQ